MWMMSFHQRGHVPPHELAHDVHTGGVHSVALHGVVEDVLDVVDVRVGGGQQFQLLLCRVRDGFRAREDGFRARVDGFRARVDGFRARVDGFRARVDGFRARVDEFRARVDGFRARVDIFRARMDGFRARVDGFRARVDGFRTRLRDLGWTTIRDICVQYPSNGDLRHQSCCSSECAYAGFENTTLIMMIASLLGQLGL
jgi:ribosomal protein L34